MIKRRFYRVEHADGDDAADSSSSSSDSEIDEHATESESESNSDDNAAADADTEAINRIDETSSVSSGYESEGSSADELNVDSTDEEEVENGKGMLFDSPVSCEHGDEVVEKSSFEVGEVPVSMPSDMPDCIFKIKSVFRCRICPTIICLTEETLRAHLKSKRHARSEKLMKENRLKAILNDDGQIENQETPAEMHARIVALAESNKKKKKSNNREPKRKMSNKNQKVVGDSVTNQSNEEIPKSTKPKKKVVKDLAKKKLKETLKPAKKSEEVLDNSARKKSKKETQKPAKKKRKSEN